MPQQLKNIQLEEVSLVDRPANPGARLLLFKRDATFREVLEATLAKCMPMMEAREPVSFDEAFAAIKDREEMQASIAEAQKLFAALQEAVWSVIDSPDVKQKKSKIQESTKQFLDALEQDSLIKSGKPAQPGNSNDGGSNPMTQVEMEKRLGELGQQATNLTKSRDEEKARADKAQKELTEALGTLTKAQEQQAALQRQLEDKEDPNAALQKRLEALPEDVRKHIEAQTAANEKMQKQLDAQREAIEKAGDERETAEFAKRAESEYGSIPAKALGSILKAAKRGFSEDLFKSLEELLAGANTAYRSLMISKGSSASHAGGSSEAFSKLQAKAQEIAKRDSISPAIALDRAVNENPELAAEYYGERRQ